MKKLNILLVFYYLLLNAFCIYSFDSIEIDKLKQKIKKEMPSLMKNYKIPGSAIALIHNGDVIWSECYGYSDLSKKTPVNKNTLFGLASISKCYTAIGVLKLCEEGKISLDDPVEKYLTRWHIPPSIFNSANVTISRLLSHTAGISEQNSSEFDLNKNMRIEDFLNESSNGVNRVQLIIEPGTQFKYSNGYSILQLLIEEVSNNEFPEYMKNKVFLPLQLNNSFYKIPLEFNDNIALRYNGANKPLPDQHSIRYADSGLYTNINDLTKFVSFCMYEQNNEQTKDNHFLSLKTRQLMFSPAKASEHFFGQYGLGFTIASVQGKNIIYHTGTLVGINSMIAFEPESGNGIAFLSNGDGGFYLKQELLAIWSKQLTGMIMPDSQFLIKMKFILSVIFFCLFFLFLFILVILVYQLQNKTRIISLKNKDKKWYNYIKIFLGLLTGIFWYLLFYTELPCKLLFGLDYYLIYTFFSPEFHKISLMIYLFSIFFALTFFLKKQKL